MALQAFDEDDSRNERRPETRVMERRDECDGISAAFGEPSNAARVKNQHHVKRPCGVGLW
jgi:hypothetical protein